MTTEQNEIKSAEWRKTHLGTLSQMGILTGRDAKRFNDAVLKNETARVSKEVADRINANYTQILKVAKF
jgi:hypothetical protein